MKAKLSKIDFQYFLYDNDDNLIGTTENSPYKRLSMENCQEIERGYNLDELASQKYLIENTGTMFMPNTHEVNNVFRQEGFKAGFQKALELMGDKKYSEEDVRNAYFHGEKDSYVKGGQTKEMQDEFIQSIQLTEWDVEIEMRSKDIDELRESNEGFLNNPNLYIPKLDASGCLILKLKSE
jgi:hypothetical protein